MLTTDKYIIYHGIKLADKSYIVNCVLDNLTVDPTSPSKGQIWYNESEKLFKFCVDIDIIKTFISFEDLLSYDGSSLIGYAGKTLDNISIPAHNLQFVLDRLIEEINSLKTLPENYILKGNSESKLTKYLQIKDEVLTSLDNQNYYTLFPINPNSETIIVNGLIQSRNEDYVIDGNKIVFNYINFSDDKITINYLASD